MASGATEARLDVVLPAGGRIAGEFARSAGAEMKALIPLGGKTLLRRSIEAFRATGRAGKIVVVGPEEVLAEARARGADGAVAEGATGPENIALGLDWLKGQPGGLSPHALIAATDLPFLTGEALLAFLAAIPADAGIAVPIMTQEEFEARFPGSVNEYVPLREGQFTIGSVYYARSEMALAQRERLEAFFSVRKSQFQMARLVGWRVALGWITRTLTVRALERRAREILGCKGVAVPHAPPELAFDIDLPDDYAYAAAQIAGKARGEHSTSGG